MTSFELDVRKRLHIQTMKAIGIGVFVIAVMIIKANGSMETIGSIDWIILIGLFTGGEVSSLRAILKYHHALKTPEFLEELHIWETDERNRIITLRICRATVNLTITLLAIAGVIASFFSQTVLLAIVIFLIGILGLYGVLSLYYTRKY